MRRPYSINAAKITKTVLGEQHTMSGFLRLGSLFALIVLSVSAWAIQSSPSGTTPAQRRAVQSKGVPNAQKPGPQKPDGPDMSALQEAMKNPELMAELGRLMEKLQKEVQFPAARNQSRILSQLPESTTFYAAVPNYGETLHQAQQIFQHELKESPQLQDFLRKNKLDAAEPKIEDGLQQLYEVSQFLGDEVVIEGKMQGKEPTGVLVAEIKKPGLREYLEKLNNEVFTSQNDRLRIFDPQQLAAANDRDAGQAPAVLIRSDFVVVGLSVAALREFTSQIDQGGRKFASNSLGQRLAKSYHAGASSVFGVDVHRLIGLLPLDKPEQRILFERSGFSDVSYLMSEITMSAAGSTNRGELAFNGPRRGIASWIAPPAPMGGLDFVSSHAAVAADVMLKSPAQIFDDLHEIVGDAAFANLPQMEAQLNINLRRDVLSKFGGEIAFEMKAPPMMLPGSQTAFTGSAPPSPQPGPFKVILRVSDPVALQRTLNQLLAAAPVQSGKRVEDGVTINTITLPSAGSPTEINYFFLDGYLVVASDRGTAGEAIRAHRSGESLAKSAKLHDALTPGQPSEASMVFYQDSSQMFSNMMAALPPELRQLAPAGMAGKPTVVSVYADESVLRGVSSSNMQAEVSVPLIVAAVAIPSLLRSRSAANESAAVASVRTVNTAQITYTASYPDKGFARDLATLGPGADGACSTNNATEDHACLLNELLANPGCTSGKWCQKNGYRYSIRAVCLQDRCLNYVVTATPVDANTGGKSFCSLNDAVVRSHSGAPVQTPLTVTECRAWSPMR